MPNRGQHPEGPHYRIWLPCTTLPPGQHRRGRSSINRHHQGWLMLVSTSTGSSRRVIDLLDGHHASPHLIGRTPQYHLGVQARTLPFALVIRIKPPRQSYIAGSMPSNAASQQRSSASGACLCSEWVEEHRLRLVLRFYQIISPFGSRQVPCIEAMSFGDLEAGCLIIIFFAEACIPRSSRSQPTRPSAARPRQFRRPVAIRASSAGSIRLSPA